MTLAAEPVQMHDAIVTCLGAHDFYRADPGLAFPSRDAWCTIPLVVEQYQATLLQFSSAIMKPSAGGQLQSFDCETGMDTEMLNLNPEGWIPGVSNEKTWKMLYGLAVCESRCGSYGCTVSALPCAQGCFSFQASLQRLALILHHCRPDPTAADND